MLARCVVFLWLVLTSLVHADWPQWRGPSGTGVADSDADPPTSWSVDKNIRWRTTLPGKGHSTPIVSGERIKESNTPATFNVLVRHLRGLGIDLEFMSDENNQ